MFLAVVFKVYFILKVVNYYKSYLKDVVRLLGATKADANEFAENMFHFEKRIAEITPTIEELQDPLATYNRLNISRLKEVASSVSVFCIL